MGISLATVHKFVATRSGSRTSSMCDNDQKFLVPLKILPWSNTQPYEDSEDSENLSNSVWKYEKIPNLNTRGKACYYTAKDIHV